VQIRLGKTQYGSRCLGVLRSTQEYYIAIGDLGGDFGIPSYNRLDSSSKMCHLSENSAKLVPFGIRGPGHVRVM
jgi:hypothetical protein